MAGAAMSLGGFLKRLARVEQALTGRTVAPLMHARIDRSAGEGEGEIEQARAEAGRLGATLLLQEFDRGRFQRMSLTGPAARSAA